MTAPDPGLTDLIAAHLTELIADAPAPNHEEDNYDAGYVAALADLRDSAAFKLVLEQHTNGRIAELEAEVEHWKVRSQYNYDCGMVLANEANARAEKAEATIARVEKLQRDLFQQGGNLIAQWGAARLIRAALQEEFIRAALEGEQQ